MMNVKKILCSLELKWTHLALISFLVFGFIIAIQSATILSDINNQNMILPLWVYILFFVFEAISLSIYLLGEYKNGYRPIPLFVITLLILLITNTVTIFSNPETISLSLINKDGVQFDITTSISIENKCIFSFSFIFYVVAIYTGVFIFSKNFSNNYLLCSLYIVFHIITIIAVTYSLINDNYVLLLEKLFGNNMSDIIYIKYYTPKSLFGNSNTYGMYLEFGLCFSLLCFSIRKKYFHLILASIYYCLLITTICKSGLIVSTILLFIYTIVFLALNVRKHNKKGIITSSLVLTTFLLIFILILILILTNEDIKNKVAAIFIQDGSLTGRTDIWSYAFQIIGTKPIFGYGYGIYNLLLFNATGLSPYSHNWIIAILGKGGILYLVSYLLLLGYSICVFFSIYKRDKNIFIATSFCWLLFFFHSFLEDLYYCLTYIIIIMAMLNNSLSKNKRLNI